MRKSSTTRNRGRAIARSTIAILLATLFAASETLAVNFVEVSRFNIDDTATDPNAPDPHDIGSNPIAVAWSGSQLYVAGFNNSGSAASVAVVEVLNATTTGVVGDPNFSSPLGGTVGTFDSSVIQSTPNSRGYTGLDISADGSSLLATFDFGVADPQALQVFNTSDGSQRWRVGVDLTDPANFRGISGGSFDPDFNGAGGASSGTAVGQLGSGRRHLYNTTTGAEIHGGSGSADPGFIWVPAGGPTITRDMDFDPDTGDVYVRHNNRVSTTERTGANTSTNQKQIFDPNGGDFVLGQNISFLSNTTDGDLLIFNNRDNAGPGQTFVDSILVTDPNGVSVSSTFAFQSGFTPADGSALYDFDFDPVSQTLAVLDFTNRNVHIFEVGTALPDDADFDDDGVVTGLDFLIWQANQPNTSGTATNAEGDATGDGNVGSADLAAWEAQYGAAPPLSGSIGAVPEPSTISLLLLGTICTFTRKRRMS